MRLARSKSAIAVDVIPHGLALGIVSGEPTMQARIRRKLLSRETTVRRNLPRGAKLFLENPLVIEADAESGISLILESQFGLRLMSPALDSSLPVEIDLRQNVIVLAYERRFRLLIGVVVHENAVTIGVRPASEADISPVIFRKATPVVVPAEVSSLHIVAGKVSESVSRSEDVPALVRLEEEGARVGGEHLKAGDRFLIAAKTSVEAEEMIMLFNEVVGRGDQPDAVLLADITLETQHADVCILVQKSFDVGQNFGVGALLIAKVTGSVV